MFQHIVKLNVVWLKAQIDLREIPNDRRMYVLVLTVTRPGVQVTRR